jgi:predicted RNA binding protein YcfA (HicA-like mRNA interferase family)
VKPVSGKRMGKVLADRGWVLLRIKGSHHHYGHIDRNEIVQVPVHGNRDLKPGTQRSIMRSAGLSDDDL